MDGISNILLKKIGPVIVDDLVVIFNKSLESGIYPDSFKSALVTPLYKNKESYMLTNYRPISLLATISKCLEKVMHWRLSCYLEKSNIFYKSQ